jgi:HIRAN domain
VDFFRRLFGGGTSTQSVKLSVVSPIQSLPPVPEPPTPPRVDLPRATAPSDRPYASELCPYCQERMDPPPKAKSRCKLCGQAVFVRSGPDGQRHLLRELDLEAIERQWAEALAHEAALRDRYDGELDAVFVAEGWDLTFAALEPESRLVDLTSDDEEAEVAGESHYQDALAEVSNLRDGVVRRRLVVAVLRPEPENPYDRNAVRVEVFGRLVGRIPREDAPEIAPILADLAKHGYLAGTRAIVVGGGVGRSGQWLSFGIRLNIVSYDDWPDVLRGAVTVRTPDR